jgi:hypothetical protein
MFSNQKAGHNDDRMRKNCVVEIKRIEVIILSFREGILKGPRSI